MVFCYLHFAKGKRKRKIMRTMYWHKSNFLSAGDRQAQAQLPCTAATHFVEQRYSIDMVCQPGFSKPGYVLKNPRQYGKCMQNEGLVPNFSFIQKYPVPTILKCILYFPILTSLISACISVSKLRLICHTITAHQRAVMLK